jgi:regulator of cell morphogenesis and NO signaling
MAIDATRTVGELATELPAATRVFEKIGIDYCCGGSRSLKDACAAAGLSPGEITRRLEEAAASESGATAEGWQNRTLTDLTAHIVGTHHEFTRSELDRLEALTDKVCGVHGTNHPELLRIRGILAGLKTELLTHMMKEEQILFPYIEQLDQAFSEKTAPPQPFFGTVRNPVRMMMTEHDSAGEALREIRSSSGDFKTPDDACISFKTLYQALEGFEQDLHQHIHLENNILFPRAVEMEDTV